MFFHSEVVSSPASNVYTEDTTAKNSILYSYIQNETKKGD